MLGADHDQINRNTHCAQRFTQSHKLRTTTFQFGLNHQQIEIGPRLRVSACMGAKENHLRIGGSLG